MTVRNLPPAPKLDASAPERSRRGLLGALLVSHFAQGGGGPFSHQSERRDYGLCIDAFQNFAFAKILSEARKQRLDIVISHHEEYPSKLRAPTREMRRDGAREAKSREPVRNFRILWLCPVAYHGHLQQTSGRTNQMKKFLVLYMADAAEFEKMMKNSTPEQQKKGMDSWMKWMGDHKASLVDGGAPLGKTKRVDSKGASDTKNGIGGYSIVQAESADAATKVFGKDQPHLQMPGAWIEVTEILQMPGM